MVRIAMLGGLPAADPGITPNSSGLPGLAVVQQIVGALLTWGLVACVAGLVVSVIIWALAHHQGNYTYSSGGRTGVLVSAGGALLIGGANAIVAFFSGLGAGI
ncbi:DUF6112 family protein [Isoptericola sp. b490]|uniref:DUF6112 family protein n=1 Tax=Actinotalea lenta TaxID=3064654 RepID=UPI0027125C18|nr:DUF6112 family protein [Isoptericola sp. b490]MDO8119698.1 DUF6112 family protein [Isoptericola sp. b490]